MIPSFYKALMLNQKTALFVDASYNLLSLNFSNFQDRILLQLLLQ